MDPSFRLKDEDTDYYGPPAARDEDEYNETKNAAIERAQAVKGWDCSEVIFCSITHPKKTFCLDGFI